MLMLVACVGARRQVIWSPAQTVEVLGGEAEPVPPSLLRAFERGMILPSDRVATLFPELHLDTMLVQRTRLQAAELRIEGGRLLASELRLALYNQRRQILDAALCTDVIVGFHAAMAVRREDLQVEAPSGAWLPEGKQILRRVGWVDLGRMRGAVDAEE